MVDLGGKTAAFAAALFIFAGVAASPAPVDPALVAARNRNPSLKAYTFHADVAMQMQTFPWLRFHLDGNGDYVRGKRYVIEFTRTPFFARNIKSIDLSALDPTLWPERFFVSVENRNDGMTTFLLRARNVDQSDPNPLVVADVTLDADEATRDVDLHYKSGEIQMHLTPGETQGYHLPVTFDVMVRMPGQTLNAHAAFTDYAITEEAAKASCAGPVCSPADGTR
ncbi:MAG: hypothetical protein JO322_07235 [Candidatus Eremiobacteraeota bacterium]|nr:hypothetical protein [Candidatus Eremiobacteraeota bacterium]